MALTDASIKALKPSAGRRYKTFDGEGLYIEVLPSGQKVWRIKWGWQGQPQSPFTLGRYPGISLKEARLKLADFKRALDAGIHPVRQKLFEQEADQNTFERVALEWLDKQKAAWDNKHWQTVKGRLERFAFPHIGAMPVRQITPTDMLRLLRLIEEQGKLSTTERVKGICSQAFRYGIAAGYCDSDPCRDLAGALIPYREKHRAAMTRPDDVALLMARIFTYQGSPIVKYALLWAAYTFCRPVEVSRASFAEIDDEMQEWRLPAERMKMRRPHRVPLPRQCLAILNDLRAWKFSDVWLFPSPYRKNSPISDVAMLAALQKTLGYGKSITSHGFRAMANTLLEEQLGYDSKLIEAQLAHMNKNSVEAAYNRADYIQQRREMVQAYADYLDQLGQKGKSRL